MVGWCIHRTAKRKSLSFNASLLLLALALTLALLRGALFPRRLGLLFLRLGICSGEANEEGEEDPISCQQDRSEEKDDRRTVLF